MDEIDGRQDEDRNAQGLEKTVFATSSKEPQRRSAKPPIRQDGSALYDSRKKGRIERIHHQETFVGNFPVIPATWRTHHGLAAHLIWDRGAEFQPVKLGGLVAGVATELSVFRVGLCK